MIITIKRTRTEEKTTDGILFINDKKICHTAEATPYRLPGGLYRITIARCARDHRNVPMITNLYEARCKTCCRLAEERERLQCKMYKALENAIDDGMKGPELIIHEHELEEHLQGQLEVLNHSRGKERLRPCSRLTNGAGVYHQTDAAILVGTHILPGIVLNSRRTFDKLNARIAKASDRGQKITLVIR